MASCYKDISKFDHNESQSQHKRKKEISLHELKPEFSSCVLDRVPFAQEGVAAGDASWMLWFVGTYANACS